MTDKESKVLRDLMVKLSNVYDSCYITRTGHVITDDNAKMYLVTLPDDKLSLFTSLVGDYKILHIPNIKAFKDDMINNIFKVDDDITSARVISKISTIQSHILGVESWNTFILSDNDEENINILNSVFKDKQYIEFKPHDAPSVIIGKNMLPLVSDKFYNNVYYSTKKISDKLHMIIFDFKFNLFDICMLYYYLPF